MKLNGGLMAGLLVVLAFLGVSNLPKNSESPGATESKKSTLPSGNRAADSKPEPYSPCIEIGDRLRRFVNTTDTTAIEAWKLPDPCYKNGKRPDAAVNDVEALPHVGFAVATVPNPVSTHLPLLFDRLVETIQQAAQDDDYSYDGSWFPWEDTTKEYSSLADQQKAKELQNIQQDQPGVMVFRSSVRKVDKDQPDKPYDPDNPYDYGLIIFLVGEQPTGGLNDKQFENALAWIKQLEGFSEQRPLRILGPTFSGSLPSLQRDLEFELEQSSDMLKPEMEIDVSSGTVSSGSSYQSFKTWIEHPGNGSYFRIGQEDDSVMVGRFCQYLSDQQYNLNYVAVLSEDETAFGGANNDTNQGTDEESCGDASGHAIRLYYPRDIATLRSAYERQSIFSAAKPQSNANGPSTTLRGDLSEPANSDHDTVRSYGGQLTPLAQESILLDITNRLNEHRIEFIILRSTNSLDQIFLSEFLRRSYPGGRVVIDGADLLLSRGAEGRSLRGVMVLSTYPLLTSEQDWTSSLLTSRKGSYRTFGEDNSEGAYIAARELFRDPDTKVPIHDYGPPRWAESSDPLSSEIPENQRPATWITVIGHGKFWPLAALNSITQKHSKAVSELPTSSDRGDQPVSDDGDSSPLYLPTMMWMFLIAFVFWGVLHVYFCWNGSILASPRARAYFAPVPLPQHTALIALGSLFIAMLAVVVAASSGLFWWWVTRDPFQGHWTEILLAISLLLSLALAFLACKRNYGLQPLRASPSPVSHAAIHRWHRWAGWSAILCFAFFVLLHMSLASKLTPGTAIPAYWRSVNLASGISPLLPQLLLIVGAYLWVWCNLRGVAHFGDDRPLLPKKDDLPIHEGKPRMPMFSWEGAGKPVEDAARPLTFGYLKLLFVVLVVTGVICAIALQGDGVRTLTERAFGVLIFVWVCLCIGVVLADSIQMWLAWNKLRQLLVHLDRLPLRRTLRALKGLAGGSIWKMSGNVLDERYRLFSLQFESLRHLENAVEKWVPETLSEVSNRAELWLRLTDGCLAKGDEFARWYVTLKRDKPVSDLTHLRDFQEELAFTAGLVMKNVLLPEWRKETDSLILNRLEGKPDASTPVASPTAKLPLHVRAAEEFFVLPYLAFIQNILGRIRTIALGSLWLFVGATLAVSSYPFDPLNVLGGIFLTVFVAYGGLTALVYSQMSRDATLSHITNTEPGALGWDFWGRLLTFGVGPLIGLLTTLFPSITDFMFSWLQPGAQALK